MFARLDCFLISDDWESTYPLATQYALPAIFSGHVPLLLDSGDNAPSLHIFHFEKMWLEDEDLKPMVGSWWAKISRLANLMLNLAKKLRVATYNLKI